MSGGGMMATPTERETRRAIRDIGEACRALGFELKSDIGIARHLDGYPPKQRYAFDITIPDRSWANVRVGLLEWGWRVAYMGEYHEADIYRITVEPSSPYKEGST